MKFAPRNDRRAHAAVRMSAMLLAVAVLPFLLHAAAPSWWSQRGVLVENAAPDDYAPANQGQLKNIAKAAVAEMDARFVGGAGEVLHALVDSWSMPSETTNDFASVNLGQLKTVAKPFYDRLIAIGLLDTYPWLRSVNSPDDFAVANLGQVKNLFSFPIPSPNSLTAESDRLATGEFSANLALQQYALWSWGDQFANVSANDRNYPRRRVDLSGIRSVAAGRRHLVVLGNDGTVSTWGESAVGQLGDGTYVTRTTAALVPNLSNIVSVRTGAFHTLALRQDGTVLAWGDNEYGQLGVGNTIASPVPIVVSTLTGVRKIAAGYQRSAALTADGILWTWGYDHYLGHDIFSTSPIALPELSDVVDVAAGYEHLVVVKADGTVWAWGSNYANQIGNGNPGWVFQDTPARVPGLSNITKVASSFEHSLALAADGTVWAWGNNSSGQLGDGTTNDRQGPIQVVGLSNVIAIATAYTYSLAMKADGTVWAWGDGAVGTLAGTDRYVPQQVGLGLLDNNHNALDDRWEAQYFGDLTQTANGDFDGDGISNLHEFLRGTNPADYFNGVTPILEIAGGNNQIGEPGTFLSKPFKVRVQSSAGQPLVNAPVRFDALSGSVASALNAPQENSVLARTDMNGEAFAYHALPDYPGSSTRTIASADSSAVSATATFRGIVKFSLPTPAPSATPPPDPNGTPTPTPSPTATPIAPYRYAIIDLGKDLYPLRVNNKGWVLLSGFDPSGTWGYYRWKSGAIERLTYSRPNVEVFNAVDMNDEGVVVGAFRQSFPWVNNAENYVGGGLTWAPDSSQAVDTRAPVTARTWDFNRTGTINWAGFTAINNKNEIFGNVRTSGGYGLLFRTFDILNAYSWGGGGQLSFGAATFSGTPFPTADAFSLSGEVDRVSRANGNGNYIGSKLTLLRVSSGVPPVLEGIFSGMVDGQSVAFDPVDINEGDIVVGWAGADMVVSSSPSSQITISGASPLAINDHTHPPPSSGPQPPPGPNPLPTPTPIPAPQILSWTEAGLAVWELQEDGHTWHPFGLEEMIPSMDGWQSLDPYDMNDTGVIVGRGWHTDPSIAGVQGEYHAFMLVPVDIVPDFNRDGKIDDNDRGQVTESEPWRFWINDDDDDDTSAGNDIPGLSASDAKDAGFGTYNIDGMRDLVDFFALYLDIEQLINTFPTSEYSYFLKNEQAALNFAYTDLKPSGAENERVGAYLKNLGVAQQLRNAEAFHITATGTQLTTSFLNKIKEEKKGVILVEGRMRTDKPLVLEVRKGAQKFAELNLQLEIDEVEKMFRQKNLLTAGGGSGGPDERLGEPANYPDRLTGNKTFVMVHGYNVNAESARGWGAEMFKRFYWTGSKAKFYSVTWYGSETQIFGSMTTDYQANVDNAFATAGKFASFLGQLNNVTVAAHSLGNILAGSAIHDWGARPSKYLMIDAAVAKESYDGAEEQLTKNGIMGMEHPDWLTYDRRLWCSDWHLLFGAGDHRHTLTWQNRLKTVDTVNMYNFYSTGEEVLKNPASQPGIPLSANEVWNKQERMKGRMVTGQILSSNYGGWAFSTAWDITDLEDATSRRRLPGETNEITSEQLKSNPFFTRGPTELYGANGPNYASPQQHRNTLLAEMIPALSFAAGANPLTVLAPPGGSNSNFDMMDYKEGWPRSSPDWQHSDIKVVAYVYIYKVYEKFVELGGLRE